MELPLLNAIELEFKNEGVVLALKFGSDPIREICKGDLNPDSEFIHRSRKRLSQTFYRKSYSNKAIYEEGHVACRVWQTHRDQSGLSEWYLYVYQGTYETFVREYEKRQQRNPNTVACDWLKVDYEAKLRAEHAFFGEKVENPEDLFTEKAPDNKLHVVIRDVRNDDYEVRFKHNGRISQMIITSSECPAEEKLDSYHYYNCDCVVRNYKWLTPYALMHRVIKTLQSVWIPKMKDKKVLISSIILSAHGIWADDFCFWLTNKAGATHGAYSVRDCYNTMNEFTTFMAEQGIPVVLEKHEWD